MKKVIAYIDGFNMYHAIEKKQYPACFQWVDYQKLVGLFLKKDWELVGIYFFTATPTWDKKKQLEHELYMRILSEHCGVTVINGNYKQVTKRFRFGVHPVIKPENCKSVVPPDIMYQTHEEKQTDVNIALHIFR
jgi:hypothetical protein